MSCRRSGNSWCGVCSGLSSTTRYTYSLCFIAVCSAVGDGCSTLSSDVDTSRQTVEYFIQGGVFFATTRCRPGFTFSNLYSSASLIRCSNSAWTSRLTSCIGKNCSLLSIIIKLFFGGGRRRIYMLKSGGSAVVSRQPA